MKIVSLTLQSVHLNSESEPRSRCHLKYSPTVVSVEDFNCEEKPIDGPTHKSKLRRPTQLSFNCKIDLNFSEDAREPDPSEPPGGVEPMATPAAVPIVPRRRTSRRGRTCQIDALTCVSTSVSTVSSVAKLFVVTKLLSTKAGSPCQKPRRPCRDQKRRTTSDEPYGFQRQNLESTNHLATSGLMMNLHSV